MSPLLLFSLPLVLYTGFLVFVHANSDTSTFASNKPFSHGRVWLERAGHVLIGAVLLYLSIQDLPLLPAVTITVAMGPLFSLLFRPVLNVFRKKAWWYMGPDLFFRMERDSWLDGLYHKATWLVTGRRFGPAGVIHKYPERLPFLLATGVDALLTVGLIWAAL